MEDLNDLHGTITFSAWLKRWPPVATVAGALWAVFWSIVIASLSPRDTTEWPLVMMGVSLALVLGVSAITALSLLEETTETASRSTPKTTQSDSPFVLGNETDYEWPSLTSRESHAPTAKVLSQMSEYLSPGILEDTLTYSPGDKIVYLQTGWEYEVVEEPPNQPLALKGMDIVWAEVLPSRTHFRYFFPNEIRKVEQ